MPRGREDQNLPVKTHGETYIGSDGVVVLDFNGKRRGPVIRLVRFFLNKRKSFTQPSPGGVLIANVKCAGIWSCRNEAIGQCIVERKAGMYYACELPDRVAAGDPDILVECRPNGVMHCFAIDLGLNLGKKLNICCGRKFGRLINGIDQKRPVKLRVRNAGEVKRFSISARHR